MHALYKTVSELNANIALFHDPDRSSSENKGPFLIVCDDFYPDPDSVRKLALQQTYHQYKPPKAEQVGELIAGQYDDPKPIWFASALLRYLGQTVNHPQPGYRHDGIEVRQLLDKLIPDKIQLDTWHESGDWWNGAFHLQYDADGIPHRVIHHHYRDGDVAPIGWSGLVYLTPEAPIECGTTIWREKITQRCIAAKGDKYAEDHNNYELALKIQNRFNRLVLFRENVLHRAGFGFGDQPGNARLTQTFFFRVEPREHLPIQS